MTTPDIIKAVEILRRGGLVAFPTETVYGLGADAHNAQAVNKVFLAKGRPAHHPLIVHIAEMAALSCFAREIPQAALQLAQVFWPGPLTLLFKKQPQVLDSLTAGSDTVAIRIPSHPLALALLRAFASGIVAPSANQFTHISPTTAAAVQEELGAKVDLILDGGSCEVGLESTIVDIRDEQQPLILRPGMISAAEMSKVLGKQVLISKDSKLAVPGRHALHYAPRTRAQLLTAREMSQVIDQLTANELPIACMVRGNAKREIRPGVEWVLMPDTPSLYAKNVYHTLRSLDHQHFKRILIEGVPDHPEWAAICDRLTKATAARTI